MSENIIKINPETNLYSYDYINCFEKPIGLVLDSINPKYQSIFLMYLKLFQSYNLQVYNKMEHFYTMDINKLIRWIINDLFNLSIYRELYETESIHEQIKKNLNENVPVMVTVNLKELSYTEHYKTSDWGHLFLLNGYNDKKELYHIIDGEHIINKGANLQYEQFNIDYHIMEKLYSSMHKTFPTWTFLSYIKNLNKETEFDLHGLVLKNLDFYLNKRKENPYKEIMFLEWLNNEILNKGFVRDEVKFEPANKLDFLFVRQVKYKYVFYKELINILKIIDCSPDIIDSIHIYKENLQKSLLEVLSTSLVSFHLKQAIDVDKTMKNCIQIENEIYNQISILYKDLINGKQYQIKPSTTNLTNLHFEDDKKEPKQKEEIQESETDDKLDEIINKLTEILSELTGLKTQTISNNQTLSELGINSLLAFKLISVIFEEYKIKLPVNVVLNRYSIKQISIYIKESKKDAITISIKSVERANYPLSFVQKLQILLLQTLDNPITYNITFAFNTKSILIPEKVEKVINKIINRHSALRTNFEKINGNFVQIVKPDQQIRLKYIELPNEGNESLIINEFIKPFELDKEPLIRVMLLKVKDNSKLIVDTHHIISDGTSISIFFKDFFKLYNGEELDNIDISYKDYSVWEQEKYYKSELYDKQQSFWINKLKDYNHVFNLPLDFERKDTLSFYGRHYSCWIPKNKIKHSLQVTNDIFESSFFSVIFSTFCLLINKYTYQNDFVIGVPVAARDSINQKDIIGYFSNVMPFHVKMDTNITFKDFIVSIHNSILDSFENQIVDYENLIEELKYTRIANRNNFFDIMFVFQNWNIYKYFFNDEEITPYEVKNNRARIDLLFEISENENDLFLNIEYNSSLFKEATIKRLCDIYIYLLENIYENIDSLIKEISLVNINDQKLILNEFNNSTLDTNLNMVNDFLNVKIENNSDDFKVLCGNTEITYNQINSFVNNLVYFINNNYNIEQNSVVALFAEPSPELLVGVYAIIKAGCIYLPIDTNCPNERISFMLKDSECKLMLTTNNKVNSDSFSCEVINISDFILQKKNTKETNLKKISPNDLAYIHYSSCHTGKPKGIMIEQKTLANRINWMQQKYPLNISDVILYMTPFFIDASAWKLFWCIKSGASLCFLNSDNEKKIDGIIDSIEKNKVTIVFFTSSILRAFLNYFKETGSINKVKSLKRVFISGEVVSLQKIHEFNELLFKTNNTHLTNLWGPVEAGKDVLYFDSTPMIDIKKVPIGKPIDNIKTYILDSNLCVTPIGIPGDLYISGIGLSRGYIKRYKLTSEKFISNPYEEGEKLFKTGDIARWLPDGNIEFLGREDNQLNINGYLIEPKEIESILSDYPGIKWTKVLVEDDTSENKILCAFYLSERNFEETKLKDYLKRQLPFFMVPEYLTQLKKIPVNSNNQIDNKELINYLFIQRKEVISPSNEIEKKISLIWSDILNIESNKISIEDSFFTIGGHSLKSMRLSFLIYKEFGVDIKYSIIFSNPTIKKLAKIIEQKLTVLNEVENIDEIII